MNGRERSWQRLALVWAFGSVLSLLAFRLAWVNDQSDDQQRFEALSRQHLAGIEGTIREDIGALQFLGDVFTTSGNVGREQFYGLASSLLERYHRIQALEWIPRVTRDLRPHYEDLARRDGLTGFRITERLRQGVMVPAADRPVYFPVYYVEPYRGNETAIGYDLGSDANGLAALTAAANSGEPRASGRVTLVQETGDQFGFLVFVPIYARDIPLATAEQRHGALRGFVLGVFRVGEMVEAKAAVGVSGSDTLKINLFDLSAAEGERHLYPKSGTDTIKQLRSGRHAESLISVAGRSWLLICTSSSGPKTTWVPWGTLAGGMLLTGLLFAALRTGQRRDAERLRAAQDLTREKAWAENLLSIATSIIVVIDLDGRVTLVNRAGCELLGREASEIVGLDWFATFIPQDESMAVDAARRELMAGKTGTFVNWVVGRGGERRLIAWNNTIVRDDDGTITHMLSSGQDITEQREAEIITEESERKYRTLIEDAPVAITLLDGDGHLIDANRMFEEMTGLDRRAILARRVQDFWPELELPRHLDAFRNLISTGKTTLLDAKIRHADGRLVPVDVMGTCVTIGGRPIYQTILRDNTERYKAEEALRLTEERYRQLFASSQDALMLLAPPSWKFTGANQATLDMFGASTLEQFTALGPWDVSPQHQPDGRPSGEKAQEMIATAMREGSHFFEWEHQRLDGQSFGADVLLTRMEVGGDLLLQATVRDISERKLAEGLLQSQNERLTLFREVIDRSNDGVEVLDIQTGRFLDVNRRECEQLGYSREELLELQVIDIDPILASDSAWLDHLSEPMDDKGRVLETVHRRKDGSTFPVEVALQRVDLGDRGVLVALARDISDRLATEAALKHAHKMEALGSFTGGAAHEINNMLLPVLSLVGLTIKELPPDGRARLRLQKVLEAAERARDLVNRMMTFARRQQEVKSERIEGAVAVAAALDLVRPVVPASIALAADVDPAAGAVMADPEDIGTLLMNLVSNAVDAIEGKPGRIDIALEVGNSGSPPHPARRRPACGTLCPPYGVRYRQGHGCRHAGAGLRSLLHHQGGRDRHRPRPRRRPRHRHQP